MGSFNASGALNEYCRSDDLLKLKIIKNILIEVIDIDNKNRKFKNQTTLL